MIEQRLKVNNPLGLHLRPAGELCQRALKYESRITIRFREKDFNAKSLLSVLSACVQNGDEIVICFSGPDENLAAENLVSFIQGGMDTEAAEGL